MPPLIKCLDKEDRKYIIEKIIHEGMTLQDTLQIIRDLNYPKKKYLARMNIHVLRQVIKEAGHDIANRRGMNGLERKSVANTAPTGLSRELLFPTIRDNLLSVDWNYKKAREKFGYTRAFFEEAMSLINTHQEVVAQCVGLNWSYKSIKAKYGYCYNTIEQARKREPVYQRPTQFSRKEGVQHTPELMAALIIKFATEHYNRPARQSRTDFYNWVTTTFNISKKTAYSFISLVMRKTRAGGLSSLVTGCRFSARTSDICQVYAQMSESVGGRATWYQLIVTFPDKTREEIHRALKAGSPAYLAVINQFPQGTLYDDTDILILRGVMESSQANKRGNTHNKFQPFNSLSIEELAKRMLKLPDHLVTGPVGIIHTIEAIEANDFSQTFYRNI